MKTKYIIFLTLSIFAFSVVGKTGENVEIDYYENGHSLKSITAKHALKKEESSLNFKRDGGLLTANTTNFKSDNKDGLTFLLVKSLEVNATALKIINYTLNNSLFEQLYQRFLAVKITQENTLLLNNIKNQSIENVKIDGSSTSKITVNQLLAPQVDNPQVASGLKFLPNGRNKLYTKSGDIWMDGEFKKGQLLDGKVFLYDADGVLLKVRIYKNGAYERDGLL
jgi:antitoxin component YwqK of YwqJK toxin-antitoxin module